MYVIQYTLRNGSHDEEEPRSPPKIPVVTQTKDILPWTLFAIFKYIMSKKSGLYDKRGRGPLHHVTVDLYQTVIDDTVSRVKGEFVQEGIDE